MYSILAIISVINILVCNLKQLSFPSQAPIFAFVNATDKLESLKSFPADNNIWFYVWKCTTFLQFWWMIYWNVEVKVVGIQIAISYK